MLVTDEIVAFYGRYDWASNFYRCQFVMDGITFTSSEQAYMYLKAVYFNDKFRASSILKVDDPGFCKAIGRKVHGYSDEEWFPVREDMMDKALYAKFECNPSLKETLLASKGKILVEASRRDRYWGCGYSELDDRIHDYNHWPGMNMLGERLMALREWFEHN